MTSLFDSSNWTDTFLNNKTTTWECPTCGDGYLECKEDLIKSFETSKSKLMQNEYSFPPEEMRIRFSGFLVCNNTECKDKIAVIGRKEIEPKVLYDLDGSPYQEYSEVYMPKFFHPEIKFFHIPEKCPEKISLQVKNAFSSYWNDLSSSANNIRKSLELIMDEMGIKEAKLHQRIKTFEKTEPEISKALMALKWVGNIGSHTGSIEKDDILNTFQVLHFALVKLYDDKETKIQNFINKINQNKGL
ncbi:MAG: DUF4145 domain-containing protein [Bacteroidetes bacterium]|jgi:hypothetical protein|nr:DUF4145 domain-containing protein [Bacteroidota bacterium]